MISNMGCMSPYSLSQPKVLTVLAANGSSPGRVVESDVSYNIIAEYLMDLATLTNTGDTTAA
jgi:hypothetical protein